MKSGLKIIGGIGVLAVAALVAVIVALQALDFNSFKDTIAAEVKTATGRDIVFGGDIDLSISLQPSLKLENVTFSNAKWGSRPQMAKLDRLEAKVRLLPLLTGAVEVEYLRLTGLDLLLETSPKGATNWKLQGAAKAGAQKAEMQKAGEFPLPKINDIRLRDVRLTYSDGASKKQYKVYVPAVDLSAQTTGEPMKARLEATLNDVALEIGAELGSLDQLVRGDNKTFPVKLVIRGDGLSANLNGGLNLGKGGFGYKFDSAVKVTNISTLEKLAAMTLPPVPDVEMKAVVSGSGAITKVESIKARLGSSDLTGTVRLNLGAAKPSITADLKSDSLNVNEITGKTSNGDDAPPKDRVFSDAPLPLQVLNTFDATVAYSAKTLKADALKLQDLKTKIMVKGGKLSIDPMTMVVGDGTLTARINANAAAATPSVSVNLSSRGLEVVRLLKEFGYHDYLTLRLNSDINVNGTGNSVRAIMAGLNGKVSMVGQNGRINSRLLKNVSSGLGAVMPWAMNEDTNAINCLVIDLPIKGGVATGRTLLLDTNGVSVQGTGQINLGSEQLALDIYPEAKNASVASFAIPMRVSGTLAKPSVGINPVSAAIGTVTNATGLLGKGAGGIGGLLGMAVPGTQSDTPAQNPCTKVLGGQAKSATPQPASQPASQPVSRPTPQTAPTVDKTMQGVKDATKGLGGAIKGIFGN